MKNVSLFVLALFHVQFAMAADNSKYIPCQSDKNRQANRSAELAKLVAEDQASRTGPDSWKTIDLEADRARRKRVGEIFGEGCFATASDYTAAALIFQHADSSNSDHYFQTFLWAKKAVELGDSKQKWLAAAGIDRFLVNTGHMQLFGTQALTLPNDPQQCFFLPEIEPSFPALKRTEYEIPSIQEQLIWVKTLNKGRDCSPPAEPKRIPSPAGTIPGFW